MKIAIHTVFLLKENILFMEEWIDYHIALGFNRFYLYDNSKVEESTFSKNSDRYGHLFELGKINKYNVNFDKLVNLSDEQMNNFIKKLCDKYKCIRIIEWSPRNKNNKITYSQVKAHNHCLKLLMKDNIKWCAYIDMDEYIVMKKHDNIEKYINSLPNKIANIRMPQIRFDSRFNNLDKYVIDINKAEVKDYHNLWAYKNLFQVKFTRKLTVHDWTCKDYNKVKKQRKPNKDEICFNHYKLNEPKYKIINNIHPNIKSKLTESKESYIQF